MTGPARIRLSRARGFRLPENAVSVARPGKLGNVFIVGKDGTRAQCAAKFAVLAQGFISLAGDSCDPDTQLALWKRIRRSARQLQGRDLACWCALDGEPCHGDVLLHLFNPGIVPVPLWLRPPGIELPRARLGMDARQFQRLNLKSALERSVVA